MADASEVSAVGSTRIAQIAVTSRLAARILDRVGDPSGGSPIECDDAHYPWERESSWLRSYLRAACDHLDLFASTFVPLDYVPGSRVTVSPRPMFALARSAMESAAQAYWVLIPDHARERASRHLRLVQQDLDESRRALKSSGREEGAAIAAERSASIAKRLEDVPHEWLAAINSKSPPYLAMLKDAASATGEDPAEAEYLWRLASAAAHGKAWYYVEANIVEIGPECEPGQYRTRARPDESKFVAALSLAANLTMAGTLRYALGMGADLREIVPSETERLARDMPLKCDVEELLARLTGNTKVGP